jgi:hypothetical protein
MRRLIPISWLLRRRACSAGAHRELNSEYVERSSGDIIQFSGSLTNNTADTVFINSNSFTFAIPAAVDDSPFLNNAPFFLVGFGSSALFEFLDVTIPPAQAAGTYDGFFTVQGGLTESTMDPIGDTAFQVTVNSTAPEPGSLLLMAAGLASLIARRRLTTID